MLLKMIIVLPITYYTIPLGIAKKGWPVFISELIQRHMFEI